MVAEVETQEVMEDSVGFIQGQVRGRILQKLHERGDLETERCIRELASCVFLCEKPLSKRKHPKRTLVLDLREPDGPD